MIFDGQIVFIVKTTPDENWAHFSPTFLAQMVHAVDIVWRVSVSVSVSVSVRVSACECECE